MAVAKSRKWVQAAVIALIGPLAWIPRTANAGPDIATINGKVIAGETLTRAAMATGPFGQGLLVNPVARQDVLNRLIETELLASAAATTTLPKDPEFVARLDEAKTRLLAEMYLERYFAAASSPAAIRAYFDRDPARFGSREIRVSQVVVSDAATAQRALADALAPGADFATVIKRYADPKAKTTSGSLGWFGRGRMIAEFENAAFATHKGQVHGHAVKTSFGYHVLKVDEERGSDQVAFQDVKERVAEALRGEARNTLLNSLKSKAKIAINSEALQRLGTATP